MLQDTITVHNVEDFAAMRRAGGLAARVLDFITPYVAPGISTERLDQLCHEFIVSKGAVPAPLNYRGFPKSICTSVNHVVCHGIPSPSRILRAGDIINIDITVILDGWHGDTSRMFAVGKVNKLAQRLMEACHKAMMIGIESVRPGACFGDIGAAIQKHAESQRFSVVRDFCGHGIGRVFHDAPNVLHYGTAGTGPVMRPGMFFTIEPMLNAGTHEVKILSDGWTAVTRDHKLSAQYEHTVGVTENGVEIFTTSNADLPNAETAPD